jgi:predicted kinase
MRTVIDASCQCDLSRDRNDPGGGDGGGLTSQHRPGGVLGVHRVTLALTASTGCLKITAMTVGCGQTRLIVLRGNSGSGKSSVANALREAYGRGVSWVSQDIVRRTILHEKDRPGGANIGLIDQVTRYSLDHGYHAVLDGIFYADRYAQMLANLYRDHLGLSRFYYLDVSIAETLRRHFGRPQAAEFGADDMRSWYRPQDLLGIIPERVIPQTSALQDTVALILAETQLITAGSQPGSP